MYLMSTVVIKPDEEGSEDLRNYSITVSLLREGYSRFVRIGSEFKFEGFPEFERLYPEGKKTVHGLAKIPGISYIGISEHSITVEKDRKMRWIHLQPQIMDILAELFDENPCNIQVVDCTDRRGNDFGILIDYMSKKAESGGR